MYVQSNNGGEGAPLQLPRDYSGSAFSAPVPGDILQNAQNVQKAPPDNGDVQETKAMPPTVPPEEAENPTPLQQNGAATAAFSSFSKPDGGALGKLPFLSAFLPPPRKKGGKRGEKEGGFLEGELFDWILIGAALLLFFTDNTDDILPLLLLLLLWD